MDAIHLAPTIALPTQQGSHGIALPAGQTIQAVVLAILENNVARIQLPQAIFDIQSSVPLQQGAHLTLALQGSGAQAKLVILASDIPAQAAPTGQPIGEATILGRVLPSAMRAAAPAAPTIPVTDAPSITPQDPVPQALAQAMRTAATRQGGLAPLFANLAQLVKGDATLPEPVRAAATQLLATQVPLDAQLSAGVLKQAVARSGMFLETHLAQATAPTGSAPTSNATQAQSAAPAAGAAVPAMPPAVQGDMKAALLVLRQVLKTWSDATAPTTPTTAAPTGAAAPDPAAQNQKIIGLALAGLRETVELAAKAPTPGTPATGAGPMPAASSTVAPSAPPPYRGAPTSAQAPVPPSIPAELPPHEQAERLLAQTDAALSRHTLLQSASLPDRVDDVRPEPAAQRLTFEIPFATPQGTAMAQFEVSRDGHRGQAEGQGPVWRARFSLDVEPMGPVHALVTIVGTRTSVTLWAEREASAARLADASQQLAQSLRQAELEPGEMQVRLGAPLKPRPAAGQFLDRAS